MNELTNMIYQKFLKACSDLKVRPTEARWKKYFKAYKETLINKIIKY